MSALAFRLGRAHAPLDIWQVLNQGRHMLRKQVIILAAALSLGPIGANAADLVVWWEKGYYPQENEAVAEIVAAFEHSRGKQVELVLLDEEEHPGAIIAALGAGRPPDFAFGTLIAPYISEWAFDDRLVDLSDAIGSFANMFDPDALERAMLVDARTGRRGLYAMPMGRTNNHLHVWKSLLEEAGLTLADIPKEWNAFWAFWCDEVQPAARQATGRDDLWGIGLPMSPVYDTHFAFFQFVAANQADYVTADGRLLVNDPEIRQKLIEVVDSSGTGPTSPPPRSSSASLWPRVGSPTISISRPSACCRRSRR
jgi:multiple sugar transport system substrate-binding protein